ncbi:spore coat protein [Zongyangia hominis]|uniref:Spore coat protein n=1 Tax=Zongyangia hominis TaxID=2763677 RepID=A0A926IC26_9FIRM|nr:spore coat protein [Zongyangia hominis]MBC8570782.1 spore coat protein [Zongyangia hominis]
MAQLSEKELNMLEDQLGYEEVLAKKYKAYAQATSDPQIKAKCEQIAAAHLNHYEKLAKNLQN